MLWLNTDGYVEGGIACAVSLHALTISLCAQELTFIDDIWLYVYIKEKESILEAYRIHAGAGAAYGTAKSGIGIAGVGTFRPDLIMKVRGIPFWPLWH